MTAFKSGRDAVSPTGAGAGVENGRTAGDRAGGKEDKTEGAEGLRHYRNGSIAVIVFDRPAALNAIDMAMAEAFHDAIAGVAADPSIRVLVLRGEGRSFMAGGDIAQMAGSAPETADRIIEPLHRGLAQMAELPIPVVASVQGPVAGAGMSIALAADLAMAADDLRFQMAYTKIGANPDASGSWHLVRLVGLRKAMELTLLSESVSAQEALALGLVNWVVPAAELEERCNALAAKLAQGAVHAFGRSKALLRSAGLRDLPAQLEAERRAFMAGVAGAEFREGTEAFLQKRLPDFTNIE